MLKTINSDGSLKISLIGSAVPAGAVYNDGLAYAPDGSLYVKLTQGALSGQVYNGGLACTPDGALYVANSTPAASATFRRGLLCRADGAVHVSDATVATVRHDGGIPKDNAGRLFVGIPLAGLALATNVTTGVTSSGGFASELADQSGNGRNLLQATGANQPIHLPFSGTKYAANFGVAANYFSTSSAPANQITGDITIVKKLQATDYSHTSNQVLIGKDDNASGQSYLLYLDTSGNLNLRWSTTGAAGGSINRTSTATVYANGLSNLSPGFVAASLDVDNGTGYEVKFWTSLDGITWTQLGSTVATVGAATSIHAGTTAVTIGGWAASGLGLIGNTYWVRAYSGLRDLNAGTGGTLAFDFDPDRDYASGSTFVSSTTGETWAINSTGSKPAQIVDRASLLFDGAAHYMKCSAFTLNQPETVYLVAKQVSWTNGELLFDGNSADTFAIYQSASSPNLKAFAGSSSAEIALPINTIGVMCVVFNGASSAFIINQGSTISGNFGSNNSGGFTLGCRGNVTLPANIQAYEALIYNVAHDAATRANVIRALMSEHGVA